MDNIAPNPKVSILIPVYNRDKYIKDCIESALNQTFSDFEIIIVDNSSTDKTWEICTSYLNKDKRIKLFKNDQNIGPVRNWMRCVENAKGELSKILFSDDTLDHNCLMEMVPKLDNDEIGFVYCAAKIGSEPNKSVVSYSHKNLLSQNLEQYLNYVIKNKAPVSPGAVLLRTVDLKTNLHFNFQTSTYRNFESNGAGPDLMIMLLTALNYKKIAYIPNPLVFFRVHKNSISIETNNAVTDGYRSVIAVFIKKQYNKKKWLSFLSFSWLLQIKTKKNILNPRIFIKSYEGTGNTMEISLFLFYCITNIFEHFLNKITKKF